jgi:hypothetical protein
VGLEEEDLLSASFDDLGAAGTQCDNESDVMMDVDTVAHYLPQPEHAIDLESDLGALSTPGVGAHQAVLLQPNPARTLAGSVPSEVMTAQSHRQREGAISAGQPVGMRGSEAVVHTFPGAVRRPPLAAKTVGGAARPQAKLTMQEAVAAYHAAVAMIDHGYCCAHC